MRLPLALPAPDSRLFDVVGFGQNSVDLVATVDEHPIPDSHLQVQQLVWRPGGEVATAMVACARLDCRTRYLGTIGGDEVAVIIETALRDEGIDLGHVRRVEAPNRFAFILVDPAGHRTVIWHRHPDMATPVTAIEPAVVASGRVLFVDATDPEAAATAAGYARAAGSPVVLDVDAMDAGVDRLMQSVDVVIAGASMLSSFGSATGDALRGLVSEFRPAVAVATLGAEGSLALADGVEIFTPAFKVDVVDSTGAGDAFRGGFVASWLRCGDGPALETVLIQATAVAALNCRALGAQTGLPTWPNVDTLVTGHRYDRSK